MQINSIACGDVKKQNNTRKNVYTSAAYGCPKDTFSYSTDLNNARKDALVNKLKNPDILYELYSGYEPKGLKPNVFNNKNVMNELYCDSDFMKASTTALLQVFDEKLQDPDITKEEEKELTILKRILEIQDDMFQNPEFSFSTPVKMSDLNGMLSEITGQFLLPKANKNAGVFNNKPAFQPAFGHVFKLGIFNKPTTRREKAEAYVNRYAALAATSAAALAQTTFGDAAALTAITVSMCRKICKTYDMPGGTTSALISKVVGEIAGKKLASMAIKYIPGAGNAANATITYSLHQLQGRALIEFCEKNYKNPNIQTADAVSSAVINAKAMNDIAGIAEDVIDKL